MMAYTNLNGVDPSRFTGLRGWGEFRGHSFEVNTSLTLINRVWHLAGPSLRATCRHMGWCNSSNTLPKDYKSVCIFFSMLTCPLNRIE